MSGTTIVPPVLYLPIVRRGDSQEFVVRSLTDGRYGLLVYTALDRLASSCGDEQEWILLPIEELARVKEAQPFDVVAFDLDVPETQRSGGRIA